MRQLEDRGAPGTTAHGSRGESALVVVLKFLSVYVRSRNLSKDLADSAQMHLNLLEEMKKEFTVRRYSMLHSVCTCVQVCVCACLCIYIHTFVFLTSLQGDNYPSWHGDTTYMHIP